jgi:serine/threonine protein kinase
MIKYYKTEQKGVLKNKLLMDYNPHAIDLSKYFEKNKNVMSIFTKIALLSNIANGLRFLNSHRIVHMDLAPKNILVSNGLLTKIIDFG